MRGLRFQRLLITRFSIISVFEFSRQKCIYNLLVLLLLLNVFGVKIQIIDDKNRM